MDEIAQGLRAVFGQASHRMNWISENLANVRTPGFRAGEFVAGPFSQVFRGHVTAEHHRVATDLTPGPIRATGRPLDMALQGDGFFVVRSGANEFLTRNGAFERTAEGMLTNAAGQEVLGVDGTPIRIPDAVLSERIEVAEDGSLHADGTQFGTLRVETVANEQQLERVGTTLFRAPQAVRQPLDSARIAGRSLESSNVSAFQSMADLMVLTRSVEAAQRTQLAETDAQRKMIEALS